MLHQHEAAAAAFAQQACGEWEGRQAVYDAHGKVVPLPEYLVPDEFVQWGILVTSMATQVSMAATAEGAIKYRLMRQSPEVKRESNLIMVSHLRPGSVFSTLSLSSPLTLMPFSRSVLSL